MNMLDGFIIMCKEELKNRIIKVVLDKCDNVRDC